MSQLQRNLQSIIKLKQHTYFFVVCFVVTRSGVGVTPTTFAWWLLLALCSAFIHRLQLELNEANETNKATAVGCWVGWLVAGGWLEQPKRMPRRHTSSGQPRDAMKPTRLPAGLALKKRARARFACQVPRGNERAAADA